MIKRPAGTGKKSGSSVRDRARKAVGGSSKGAFLKGGLIQVGRRKRLIRRETGATKRLKPQGLLKRNRGKILGGLFTPIAGGLGTAAGIGVGALIDSSRNKQRSRLQRARTANRKLLARRKK